jgi:transposase
MFTKLKNRHHNVTELCFIRLNQNRSVATRHDMTSTSFQAAVTIAVPHQWL